MKQSIIASSPTVLFGKSKFSPNTVVQWLGALRFFYRGPVPEIDATSRAIIRKPLQFSP